MRAGGGGPPQWGGGRGLRVGGPQEWGGPGVRGGQGWAGGEGGPSLYGVRPRKLTGLLPVTVACKRETRTRETLLTVRRAMKRDGTGGVLGKPQSAKDVTLPVVRTRGSFRVWLWLCGGTASQDVRREREAQSAAPLLLPPLFPAAPLFSVVPGSPL